MHKGFQCLLNKYSDDTDLQYYEFGDPSLAPTTPADLHPYVTHMFQCHFREQPTSAPALHDGSVSWDTLQHMSYEEFRLLHSGLNVPITTSTDPLY